MPAPADRRRRAWDPGAPLPGFRSRARGAPRTPLRRVSTSTPGDGRSSVAPYLLLDPQRPMATDEGAKHAVTNVDWSASLALAPGCDPLGFCASVKCAFNKSMAGADRASDGGSAITMCTKSAMAASGFALDHCFTPGSGFAVSM